MVPAEHSAPVSYEKHFCKVKMYLNCLRPGLKHSPEPLALAAGGVGIRRERKGRREEGWKKREERRKKGEAMLPQKFSKASAYVSTCCSAIWANLPGLILLVTMCSLCGMVVYAEYRHCDPLATDRIHANDQVSAASLTDRVIDRLQFQTHHGSCRRRVFPGS